MAFFCWVGKEFAPSGDLPMSKSPAGLASGRAARQSRNPKERMDRLMLN
jgi:hypothetical protein